MLTIRETNIDGTTKELTFSSKTEAAEAIRTFFGFEKSEAQKQVEQRQALNDSLREQFRRGQSTSNPRALIENARASNRWQGE